MNVCVESYAFYQENIITLMRTLKNIMFTRFGYACVFVCGGVHVGEERTVLRTRFFLSTI